MAARGAHDLWLPFLARWGLLLAVVLVGLFTTFFAAFGMVASQPGIGGDPDELLRGAHAPGTARRAIPATTRTVAGIISAHFAAGQLTIGLAFLAVGSAALATSWVPRSI